MAELFGQHLTKAEILKRVGNIESLASARRIEYKSGRANGLSAYEVRCGRLQFSVLTGKCMDIGGFYLDGVPLHFLAKPGTMAADYLPDGPNAARSIMGGLLVTCGLTNVGPFETLENGRTQPQHGYIRTTPAENDGARGYWDGDDYRIELFGEMRETALFEQNLVLRRSITTKLGDPAIIIRDEIENEGASEAPLMLLYHFNAGYPLLGENTKLIVNAESTTPRDDAAKAGMAQQSPFAFGLPADDFAEQVFYHKLREQDGYSHATLYNEPRELALRIDYSAAELPEFCHWKSRASGDYVVGLEPANCRPEGLKKQRESGELRMLAPGERIRTDFIVSAASGKDAAALADD